MSPTVFPSVDAALADLKQVLPILKSLGKGHPDSKKLIDFIESGKLRAALEKMARPDGSVQFSFSPEAWKELRKFQDSL